MKTTKSPTIVLKLLTLPFLALSSFAALAQEALPPPGILDSYACTYNPGKDADDLMAARDFYLKQSEKAGVKAPDAYLWTLMKGSAPVNVVWFDVHENLAAFAASADASMASAEMQASNERFESVITCQSGVSYIRPLHERKSAEDGPNMAFITSSACNLKHGQGQANVADLMRHISGVMKGMGDNSPNAAYAGSPISSGPNTPDLYLFAVHDNVTAYSKFVSALTSSDAGQMLGRHFNTVLDCNMSMWTSTRMVGGS